MPNPDLHILAQFPVQSAETGHLAGMTVAYKMGNEFYSRRMDAIPGDDAARYCVKIHFDANSAVRNAATMAGWY